MREDRDLIGRGLDLVAAGRRRAGRWWLLVPTISLLYGLLSAYSLTRDYAHSQHLIVALGASIVVSILIRWKPHRFGERAAHFTTRFAVQYIVMFCIPLLYFASAWFTLTLALIVGGATFSSRAWVLIAREESLTAGARCFAFVLATSFAYVVLLPTHLNGFYPTLGAVAVLAALPWRTFGERRRPNFKSLVPALLVSSLVISQGVMNAWIRIPALSLWLKRPAIGLDIEGRELMETLSPRAPISAVGDALASGREICCLTPIVAPRGVHASVVHEWRADGEIIDRIELPAAAGTGDPDQFAFRTFSCKHNLPDVKERLECRVFLGGTLYVGRARLDILPISP